MTPAVALAGAVDGQLLRAAGWTVRGSLRLTPYDDPAEDVSYVGLSDLLADKALQAVALDGDDPLTARHLPALLAHGLHVLLPTPGPLDPDLLRHARQAQGTAEVVVGLLARWEPWALTVAAALPLVGTPVLQATVRGWPRGAASAAELVDLARSWCGDVLSVAAVPAPLPATTLGPGLPVAWALLHEGGATTLVSHEGPSPLARLSFATARLEAGPHGARWHGGAELPLLEPPDRRDVPFAAPVPAGCPNGLLSCAVSLAEAALTGEVDVARWPWPADLGDLQAAAAVLEGLRESARRRASVRVG